MLKSNAVDIEIEVFGLYKIHTGLFPGNLLRIETQGKLSRALLNYDVQYAPGACKVKPPDLVEINEAVYQPFLAGGVH